MGHRRLPRFTWKVGVAPAPAEDTGAEHAAAAMTPSGVHIPLVQQNMQPRQAQTL